MKKAVNSHKFPHFFRVISEALSFSQGEARKGSLRSRLRPIMLSVLMGGICLFIVLNVLYQTMLPTQFKQLLSSPSDEALLSQVYLNTKDQFIRRSLYSRLDDAGLRQALSKLEAVERSDEQKINALKQLIVAAPSFPDSYAYLATLYFKNRSCAQATTYIQKAKLLDPNREEFRRVEESINKCK